MHQHRHTESQMVLQVQAMSNSLMAEFRVLGVTKNTYATRVKQ